MTICFVSLSSPDFRMLADKLDAYYFELVGDIQSRYAEPNRPENMTALAVAYEDGTPIACGAWKRLDDATAELKRLYVLPEFRRKGVARGMIAVLEENAASAGIRHMILETAVDTADSHQLYLSAGYQITDYYGSPARAENCLCFCKEL